MKKLKIIEFIKTKWEQKEQQTNCCFKAEIECEIKTIIEKNNIVLLKQNKIDEFPPIPRLDI